MPQLVEELQTLGKSQDRLGDVLIRLKKIQTPQLLDALVEQRETGRRLGEILVSRGLVTQEDVSAALRSQGVNRLEDTRADANAAYWQQSTPDGVLDGTITFNASPTARVVATFDGVSYTFQIDLITFEPVF